MSDPATSSGTDDSLGHDEARPNMMRARMRRARVYEAIARLIGRLTDRPGAPEQPPASRTPRCDTPRSTDAAATPEAETPSAACTSSILAAKLREATDGLTFMSETDAPVEVWAWSSGEPFAPEALRDEEGIDPDAPLETGDIDRFFRNAVKEYDWQDDAEKQQARRFAALRDLLKAELRDLGVLRFGAAAADVYVVGTAPDGVTMGVRTKVVET